jgi:hypothetical protein
MAIIVSVGFWHADDTKQEPSATNRLGTSWDWQNGLSTEF